MYLDWLVELGKGTGRFFLFPLLYIGFVFAIYSAWRRIKRERRSFNIRVFYRYLELKGMFGFHIWLGFVLSVLYIGMGLVLPFGTLVLTSIITLLFCIPNRFRLISPSFTIGFTILGVTLLPLLDLDLPGWKMLSDDWQSTSLTSLSILLATFVVIEGILIRRKSAENTSPHIRISKRGYPIGVHLVNRLWLLPVFLLLPNGTLSLPFDWWPLLTVGNESYQLMLVPFLLGFSKRVQGMLPAEAAETTGNRVLLLSFLLAIGAVTSYWYPIMGIAVAVVALIGRELIALAGRLADDALPFYFAKRPHGLVILGVLPNAPAAKMGLSVGEVIVKVNGEEVRTEDEFYLALHKNRAYCKLEVLDTNGQIRFAQRALYDGEHHELGILFITTPKNKDISLNQAMSMDT